VMQQALEYLNVPHDIDVKAPSRRVAKLKDSDLDEGSPDRLTGGLEMAVADMPATKPAMTPASTATPAPVLVPAVLQQAQAAPASGTVVVDVEGGGLVVPSLIGKPVRAAVEMAQEAGFEIDVVGDGLAREQAPPAGTRIAPGGHVAVRFTP